jgi:hypothetical protein
MATKIKQVSVFLENRPGRLMDMLQVLSDNGIDIRALSQADTADFGIARLVLSDTDKAVKVLAAAGFTASLTDVLQVMVKDQPGGFLQDAAVPLARAGINVEYVYAFVDQPQASAMVVLKVSDPDKALDVLGR